MLSGSAPTYYVAPQGSVFTDAHGRETHVNGDMVARLAGPVVARHDGEKFVAIGVDSASLVVRGEFTCGDGSLVDPFRFTTLRTAANRETEHEHTR